MVRETWGRKAEFMLSAVGYAVGLGNVWRFPYLCYDNGGGAFLIPYFTILIIAVLPVMVMDASLGQFTSFGCVTAWKFSPMFKGVGIAMVLISAYCVFYYPIIIAYTIRYMVASLYNPLPWTGCNNTWNTPNCYERGVVLEGSAFLGDVNSTSSSLAGNESTLVTILYYTVTTEDNTTFVNGTQVPKIRASEEFWKHGVLDMSEGLHDIGSVKWQLLLCLVLTWIIVYVCVMKGIKSTGKAVYFTATFPYIVLFILLIRGLTLPGAIDGIRLYLTPDFSILLTSKVWKAAANQVFYSYGTGWGGILTLSSYNKFRNNSVWDAIIISFACGFSSIFAGFVIFSVIGFMAHDSQLPIEEVVSAGPGLAFVAYPETLARLPLPQLWSFLFFFMLLTVGLDSQFVMLETFVSALVDEISYYHPEFRKHHFKIILGTSLLFLTMGVILTTQGGLYIMTLLDWYSAGSSPMILVIFEVLVMSYIYGAKRFMGDIKTMIGYTPCIYWQMCWMFSVPAVISLILIFSFVDYTAATLGDYTFPPHSEAIGWAFTMTSVVTIFVYAAVYLYHQEGPFLQRLKASVGPSPDWGPARNEDRIKAGYSKLATPDAESNSIDKSQVNEKQAYIPLDTKDTVDGVPV